MYPQSQGYIEGRHQSINRVLLAFAAKYPDTWSRYVKLAQWSLRATPRADRGGHSPYELVTGLVPQGPLNELFRKIGGAKVQNPSDYVADLQRHLKGVYDCVSVQLSSDLEVRKHKGEREAESDCQLKAGDHVFLRRPPAAVRAQIGTPGLVSDRLVPKAAVRIYEVVRMTSPQTCLLCDPDARSQDLGFAQPVHISRLIPYTLCALEAPVHADKRLWLEMRIQDEWHRGEIVAQQAAGLVRIKFADGEVLKDLSLEEHRWIYPSTE